jgi:hypothetical protein
MPARVTVTSKKATGCGGPLGKEYVLFDVERTGVELWAYSDKDCGQGKVIRRNMMMTALAVDRQLIRAPIRRDAVKGNRVTRVTGSAVKSFQPFSFSNRAFSTDARPEANWRGGS